MNVFNINRPPVSMKVGEEKETGSQHWKKKLLKEGHGWDTPEFGDEVEGIINCLLFFGLNRVEIKKVFFLIRIMG